MKRDLPYYIARFLLVRPELNIPGFGRFYSSYKSAFFQENEIHPPSYAREFSPSPISNDVDDFCDFLKYQTGRGEVYIKKTVKDFIAELKKGAKRKAGIPIEGLGTFTSSAGKIHADIDNVTFGHYFSGLPNVDNHVLGSLITQSASAIITKDIADSQQGAAQADASVTLPGVAVSPDNEDLTPSSGKLATPQKNEEKESETEKQIEEEKVSIIPVPISVPADHTSVKTVQAVIAKKTSFTQTTTKAAPSQLSSRRHGTDDSSAQNYRSLFWVLGIILLLLVISAFLLLTDVLEGGSKAKYGQSKVDSQIESEEGIISETDREEKSTKEIQDELESSLSPKVGGTGSSEKSAATDRPKDTSGSGEEHLEAGQPVVGSDTKTIEIESGKSDEAVAGSAGAGNAGNVPGKGKDCMVVVGAFKLLSNADRMEAKLAKMGYQPYTEVRKGLTHVGVLSPCRTTELRKVLYRGRAEIDDGAWVLRVHGTPPGQEM